VTRPSRPLNAPGAKSHPVDAAPGRNRRDRQRRHGVGVRLVAAPADIQHHRLVERLRRQVRPRQRAVVNPRHRPAGPGTRALESYARKGPVPGIDFPPASDPEAAIPSWSRLVRPQRRLGQTATSMQLESASGWPRLSMASLWQLRNLTLPDEAIASVDGAPPPHLAGGAVLAGAWCRCGRCGAALCSTACSMGCYPACGYPMGRSPVCTECVRKVPR
jgi:hypothetical protein